MDIKSRKTLFSDLENLKSAGTYLFFDTETTGLPRNWNAPVEDVDNWPRMVQIAWAVYKDGVKISSCNYIIKPEGFEIPTESSKIHGITNERADREGVSLQIVLKEFYNLVKESDFLVAHNISFDQMIVGAELLRNNMRNIISTKEKICNMEISTSFCAIPKANKYGGFKWPKLSELHMKLFGEEFNDSHNAMADVEATAKCFWEMKRLNII
jgi:DNA polymerase III epsilon subunit-like protein